MDRRDFVRLSGGALALTSGLASLRRAPAWAAQEAASLSGLGLPEVTVTLSEADGFAVSPAETPAGWTLITFESGMPAGNYNTSDLMMLPEGQTLDDVIALVTSEEEVLPEWVADIVSAGGPGSRGGETAQAVVLLTEGDWSVWSAGEAFPGANLTVTAGSSATPEAPTLTADAEVEFQEFAFVGLDELTAGPQIWKIENTGEQSHVMVLFQVPDGTTTEQLMGSFIGMMTGTPAPDAIDFGSVSPFAGCGDLSSGRTAWHALDLSAGTYGAVCFVPDEETGAPHIMLGMGAAFSVA